MSPQSQSEFFKRCSYSEYFKVPEYTCTKLLTIRRYQLDSLLVSLYVKVFVAEVGSISQPAMYVLNVLEALCIHVPCIMGLYFSNFQ